MTRLTLKTKLILLTLFICLSGFSQQSVTLKWHTNFHEILSLAKAQNKPVLLFFHGSDLCPPCKRMQKEIFANPEFIDFASDKILFLDVDFPYKNKLSEDQFKHNNNLKKRYGLPEEFTQGFPQVVIVNQNDKVLYQEKGYNGEGSEKLTAIIKKLISEM